MAVSTAITNKLNSALKSLGRTALAAAFPRDFETYICSLELADSKDNTIDSFIFPIMPNNITKTELKRETILNTAGGITVLNSPIFTPQQINIRGDFGRNFKILISSKTGASLLGAAFSIPGGAYQLIDTTGKSTTSIKSSDFDPSVKTGFGCIKILQSIISKSNGLDENGSPFRLYFYNLALGESYLVVIPPSGITYSQNMNRNMIWEYNLNMTAIAPLEAISKTKAKSSTVTICASSEIQKGVNTLATTIAGIL